MLTLFITISRLKNSIERKIFEWELDIGTYFDTSFITRIKKILNKYKLPTAEEIMEQVAFLPKSNRGRN